MKTVRDAVKNTRDAFSALLAQISFAIALTEAIPVKAGQTPQWMLHWIAAGFPLQWVNNLAETGVGDFTSAVTRPDYFLDLNRPSNLNWACLAQILEPLVIPVWFWWGDEGGMRLSPRWKEKWRPTRAEIDGLHREADNVPRPVQSVPMDCNPPAQSFLESVQSEPWGGVPSQNAASWAAWASAAAQPPDPDTFRPKSPPPIYPKLEKYPLPASHSCQRRGKWPANYLQRQAKYRKQRWLKETPAA